MIKKNNNLTQIFYFFKPGIYFFSTAYFPFFFSFEGTVPIAYSSICEGRTRQCSALVKLPVSNSDSDRPLLSSLAFKFH
jgi:hypothetical protein